MSGGSAKVPNRRPARPPLCEYGRCGGLGHRAVKRKRRARQTIRIGARLWHVCESCADLLLRDAAAEGYEPARARERSDEEA